MKIGLREIITPFTPSLRPWIWLNITQSMNFKKFISLENLSRHQGRSDGVSRVSNAYVPTAERGPPKAKNYTRYFKKNCQKWEKYKFWTFCLRAHKTLATALRDTIKIIGSTVFPRPRDTQFGNHWTKEIFSINLSFLINSLEYKIF